MCAWSEILCCMSIIYNAMGYCKKDITPLLMHWSYFFLALTHWMPLMPPSHCCELCLRTNTNWHLLRIAQHCIDSNYLVLVRCHFRISSQANTNVLKCSKHSYCPCESKSIRIGTYCIAERRIISCQFLLVCISSYISIDSLHIHTGVRRLSAATQYIAIPCAMIALSNWIPYARIGRVSSY